MKTNPCDSIHITPDQYDGCDICLKGSNGLTKREYFAAIALQGLTSAVDLENTYHHSSLTTWAVDLADSLIQELNK